MARSFEISFSFLNTILNLTHIEETYAGDHGRVKLVTKQKLHIVNS